MDTDNIMIFMFHNIGELDEFSKTYKNLISEYYFIQHDHQDIIMLENEYKKVLQDRLLLLNPLGVDEIENLLSYRLMDYYLDHPRIIDENSEDINKIAIMIKNTTKAIMKPIIVDNPQPLLFNFFILSPKIIIQN